MAVLRPYIVLSVLVCGLIVYITSPHIHWSKEKKTKQTQSRKHDVLLSHPQRPYQLPDVNKQLNKDSSLLPQTITDNSSVQTDFSVTEYIQKLNQTKGAKKLLVAADSHGEGLQKVFKKYLPGWKVQVAFYPGYRLEQVQRKVKNLLSSLSTRNHSFIILHAGTNNFYQNLHRRPLIPTPGVYKERHSNSYIINSAETVLKALTEYFPNASVIYSANLPRADIPEYPPRKEFVNQGIKTRMATIPRTHFVDHSPLFHDKTRQADKRLLKKDLVHMNTAGQDLIVRNLIRTMAKIPQQ